LNAGGVVKWVLIRGIHMHRALMLAWETIRKSLDAFFAALPNLIVGIILFLAFLAAAKHLQNLVVKVANRAGLDSTLAIVLGSLTRFAVGIGGFLVAAVVVLPGFSPGNLVAGLGITSVAIGFAFQDILKNFFAGILLLWQQPFRIGDEIKTGEYEGTVEEINIRATLLRKYSGELIVLPNGKIYSDPIIVLTAGQQRRVRLSFKVENAIDFDDAREIIFDTLASTGGVNAKPEPQVYIGAQDDKGSVAEIYFWCAPQHASILAIQDRVTSEIRRKLSAVIAAKKASALEPASNTDLVPSADNVTTINKKNKENRDNRDNISTPATPTVSVH
jgi:small conductance mechanosensitive channel